MSIEGFPVRPLIMKPEFVCTLVFSKRSPRLEFLPRYAAWNGLPTTTDKAPPAAHILMPTGGDN